MDAGAGNSKCRTSEGTPIGQRKSTSTLRSDTVHTAGEFTVVLSLCTDTGPAQVQPTSHPHIPSILAMVSKTTHPHTRGEIEIVGAATVRVYGSPPHAWGDWLHRGGLGLLFRFTPTRVGRFCRWPRTCSPWTVHPHTRGEIAATVVTCEAAYGSPPTRVGRFVFATATTCLSAVHPHTRGEIGSNQDCRPGPPRFTPTRVGRLCVQSLKNSHTPVHPHTRGEIALMASARTMRSGSPPHAWGDSGPARPAHPRGRFTPTRVGRFQVLRATCGRTAVHPHTRGEIPRG